MKIRTILICSIVMLIAAYASLKHYEGRQKYTYISVEDAPWSWQTDLQSLNLGVADNVISHLTPYHSPVELSAVSIVMPAGFEATGNPGIMRRGADSSISVQTSAESFYEQRQRMRRCVGAPTDPQGRQLSVLYTKEFRFNNYDAMMVCVSDRLSHISVWMSYGDGAHTVDMIGKCRAADRETLDQIVSTFLSSTLRT